MFELNAARFEVNGRCLLEATDLRFTQGLVYGLIGHNGWRASKAPVVARCP